MLAHDQRNAMMETMTSHHKKEPIPRKEHSPCFQKDQSQQAFLSVLP